MPHVVVSGGRILQLATGILQDAANPIQQANTLIGANVYASGGTAFSSEGFPIFKNRVREGRGFTQTAALNTQVPLSGGWPTTDFACFLWEGSVVPSWLTTGTFKCGFTTTTGTETIAGIFGGNTVANIVRGSIGTYTTFDMTFTGQGGFQITGTSGTTTNVYAYLPGYNMGAIDDVTKATAFTAEAIQHYGQYSHIRVMKAQCVEFNARLSTSANRNTLSNFQAAQGATNGVTGGNGAYVVTLTGMPVAGATSATLTAGWPLPSDQYVIPFHSPAPTVQGRVCTMTQGSASFTWADALTANTDSTGLAKVGKEAYPVEWWVSLANACNIGLWLCRPTLEDGTDYAPGSWSSDVLTYIKNNWTSTGTVYIEDVNENWNAGTYQSFWGMNGIAFTRGYWTVPGDVSSYYAFRAHTFANLARSIMPAMFGTKVKQVMCWQTNNGGAIIPRKVFTSIVTLGGTPNQDIQLHAIAPYLSPATFVAGDSIATLQSKTATEAVVSHLAHWTENNVILAAHWGIPFGSYEDNGNWGASQFSTITNLPAAIKDAGMQAPLTAHIQSGFDCGKQLVTHFADGVSVQVYGVGSSLYELTDTYAAPLVTAQGSALASFFAGFTFTRNLVSASGSIVDGVNYADNNATISATKGSFNVANSGLFMPYGQSGYIPYRINCTDPRANSGAVTYTLVVTFSAVSGTPTTNLEIGDPTRGFSSIASGVSVANGAITVGTITLVKGVNYVLLGKNGAQGTSAQNLIQQLQFN